MKRLFIVLVLYIIFFSSLSFGQDCVDVDGTTETIDSDCTGRLYVTGDGSNITIDSGVTVSGQTSNDRFAIDTTGGTNTTIQYQELPYKSKAETNVYVYYTIGL